MKAAFVETVLVCLFVFIIRYCLYLHFKCYLLSWFPPLPVPGNPLPHSLFPCFYEGVSLIGLPCPGILPHWGIELSQDQGSLLPLMFFKAILCYLCIWSHGSLHVYCLVGGLVPGSSGISGWLILLFFLWGCKPFSARLKHWLPLLRFLRYMNFNRKNIQEPLQGALDHLQQLCVVGNITFICSS